MKIVRSFMLLWGFFSIGFGLYSQEKLNIKALVGQSETAETDSLKFVALEKLILHYANSNIDSMSYWLDKAYGVVDTSENSYLASRLLYFEGERLFKAAKYPEAIKLYNRCIPVFKTQKKTKELSSVYSSKALVYLYSGAQDSVMFYSTKALKGFESLQDTFRQINTLLQIIQLQNQLGNLESSKKYLDQARDLVFESKNKKFYGFIYNNYGILYYTYSTKYEISEEEGSLAKYTQALDSAFYYYDKSEKVHREMGQEIFLLSTLYNKGLILEEKELWREALNTFDEVKVLVEKYRNPSQIARVNTSRAQCFAKLNQPEKAITILKANIDFFEALGEPGSLIDTYNSLSTAYAEMGDFKNAYYYKNMQFDKKLEMLDETTIAQVNELEKKYETEKIEAEVTRLSLEDELNQSRISNQRHALLGSLLGVTLLSVLAFRLFRQKKKIRLQNQLVSKALDEKDLLLREIHHRVKNNLQLVSSLLGLQSYHIKDPSALEALNSGKSRVKSMALIHQDLYNKENLTGVSVREYLEKLSSELMESFNIDKDLIQLETDIPEIILDVDTLVPLGLIINELLTNALKYAFPEGHSGKIKIRIYEDTAGLKMDFSDNGIGFDIGKQSHSSFGFRLINTLLEQLEGEMDLKVDNGTQLNFKFTEYKIAA